MTNETTFYRVQQVSSDKPREFLTGAMTMTNAFNHLSAIVDNLQANGYLRTDNRFIRKLPVVMLVKELRTVTLSVVECSTDDITGTRLDLREFDWLTRTPEPMANLTEDGIDYTIDPDRTPSEFDEEIYGYLREGDAGVGVEVAQNG